MLSFAELYAVAFIYWLSGTTGARRHYPNAAGMTNSGRPLYPAMPVLLVFTEAIAPLALLGCWRPLLPLQPITDMAAYSALRC